MIKETKLEDHQYEVRRERLLAAVQKQGCQMILVTNFTNVSYLTGFSGDDSWLLVSPKNTVLVSDTRYTEQIMHECPGLNAHCRVMGEDMISTVSKLFRDALPKGAKIGIEGGSMTVVVRDALADAATGFTLVALSDPVEILREVKDESEISAIRKAITCACRAFNAVRHTVEPWHSELDFSRELECAMLKLGSQERAFPSIVAVGARAALPHAVPTSTAHLGDSELLLVDWGAKVDSYMSDLTRVLITRAKPTKRLRSLYNAVLKAQKAAIDFIKPGIPCCEVDAVARGVLTDAGHGKAFSHNLGHGLGRVVHDRGGFRVGNKTLLKPGMVITVEPGIYYPDWGGIRIEDDILVTKKGCEVLSEGFPKEFDDMFLDMS